MKIVKLVIQGVALYFFVITLLYMSFWYPRQYMSSLVDGYSLLVAPATVPSILLGWSFILYGFVKVCRLCCASTRARCKVWRTRSSRG